MADDSANVGPASYVATLRLYDRARPANSVAVVFDADITARHAASSCVVVDVATFENVPSQKYAVTPSAWTLLVVDITARHAASSCVVVDVATFENVPSQKYAVTPSAWTLLVVLGGLYDSSELVCATPQPVLPVPHANDHVDRTWTRRPARTPLIRTASAPNTPAMIANA